MSSIPMYDASEFLTVKDASGIIGFGSFGRVRDCFHQKLGRAAVKCFGIQGTAQDAEILRQKLSSEAEILQNINHHQIVQCQGVTVWLNAFGIVMEYMAGGNLDDFLLNPAIKEIGFDLRLRIVEELCEALAFLHYFTKFKTIVHGDLKPHNILLTADLHAKLADFGAAQIAMSTGSSSTLSDGLSRQHTVLYTAPEFLQDITIPRTPAMDIYSLSMIIYEVLTRMRVFHGISGNIGLVISTIINRGQRPDQKPINAIKEALVQSSKHDASRDLTVLLLLEKIMQDCWQQNPTMRPEIGTVRDRLAKELTTLKVGDMIIRVGETVNQMKLGKRSKATTMVPLNHFLYPFEIANSRKMSRSSSQGSIQTAHQQHEPQLKTVAEEANIIIFIANESNTCDVFKYCPTAKTFAKLPILAREWNDSTAVVLHKCIYVLSSNSVECLNLADSNPKWKKRPGMIKARTHAAAAVSGGKIYIFGGIAKGNKVLSSVECFDPVKETWSVVDNLKRHRFSHNVISANGKLYCVGGANTAVECYDPTTRQISDIAHTPNKNGFATVYCNGVIYDIGRKAKVKASMKGTKSQVVMYNVDCYNIQNDFWYKASDLTTNRSQGCACAVNGRIYLVGGWGKLTSQQYIEMYDPAKDEWETVTSMNYGFVQNVCVVGE